MRSLIGWCTSISLLVFHGGVCIILDTQQDSLAELSPHAGDTSEASPAGLAEGSELSTSSSNASFPFFYSSSAEGADAPDGDHAPTRSQAQYLVDNGQLHSKHAGLSYRFSKHLNDLDKEHFELYGTIITGEVADGWLRVGDRYLPMTIGGKTVLALQSVVADRPLDLKDQEQVYLVVQPQQNSSHKGISFRWSKKLADRDVGHYAPYNTTVKGVDCGDGWLQVGDRYLPMAVAGKRVLVLEKPVNQNKYQDVEALYTFAKHPMMWFTIVIFGLGFALVASLLGPAPTRRGDMLAAKGQLRPRKDTADESTEEAIEDISARSDVRGTALK